MKANIVAASTASIRSAMSAASEPVAASPHSTRYPGTTGLRDLYVLERREARPFPDPFRHQGVLLEDERDEQGRVARVATVFLTGRECRWRCAMCDLWRHTIPGDTPVGAIPAQIDQALGDLQPVAGPQPTHVKLYNASSFFDPQAVPEADYGPIAERLAGFDHVVVESHPALIGPRVDRFQAVLGASLEVAMGLETAHPGALEGLNKRMSLDQFARAAEALHRRGVALRAFVLVFPPFVLRPEQDEWLVRSVDFAFACGASAVSLIPTRAGNGALEALAQAGSFEAPTLADLERSLALGLEHSRGRVFADLWDLGRFAHCAQCHAVRADRLRLMSLEQRARPAVDCAACANRTCA
jgi:archaeosine synthase beta-subunit